MAKEEFEVLKSTDLSAEDKWNILYNYIDFNARLMCLQALARRDDKKAYSDCVSSAASLKTIRDIMKDDKALILAMAEMQDPKNEVIRSFPMPYDFE